MDDSEMSSLGSRLTETTADCYPCFETSSAARTLARDFLPAKDPLNLPTGVAGLVPDSDSGFGSELCLDSGPALEVVLVRVLGLWVAGSVPKVGFGAAALALPPGATSESHLCLPSLALGDF